MSMSVFCNISNGGAWASKETMRMLAALFEVRFETDRPAAPVYYAMQEIHSCQSQGLFIAAVRVVFVIKGHMAVLHIFDTVIADRNFV
jgi:hypothetical protein